MNFGIISLYYNLIIKNAEKLFCQNMIKNIKKKEELDYLYLKTLLAIEDEIKYCTKKETNL